MTSHSSADLIDAGAGATVLREAWDALRAATPGLRIRDAAARLGSTEMQLLATRCGDGVTRLSGPWHRRLRELPRLGRVMVLSRNEVVVHEKIGCYERLDIGDQMGIARGEDIDLRLFMSQWAHGFAVAEGDRHSLQFFAADGRALHKVYVTEPAGLSAWEDFACDWAAEDQSPEQTVEPPEAPAPERPDADVDVETLRRHWDGLHDVHAFAPMLAHHVLGRQQALRLAGPHYAVPLPLDAPQRLLQAAAQSGQPIRVLAMNPGIVQVHTGLVHHVEMRGPWLNVLDENFSLHLRTDLVASAWCVRKPSYDGDITSIELFDAAGENVALFFGARKPGLPEREDWRQLTTSLGGQFAVR